MSDTHTLAEIPFKQKMAALDSLIKVRDKARQQTQLLATPEEGLFANEGSMAAILATQLLEHARVWAWADSAISIVEGFDTLTLALVSLGANPLLTEATQVENTKAMILLTGLEE